MYVALLRAVNVAGHGTVSMAELRDLVGRLGFSSVRTVLQSGNVVFEADRRQPEAIERLLERGIAARLKVTSDCFVRTSREWTALVAANPFPDEARANPGRLVLMCLKAAPAAKSVAALQAAIRGPEVVRPNGRHLYLVYPEGIGRSRLTGTLIERALGARGTARNWNTVLRLAALLEKPTSGFG
jgi:uncharacterized protein (DUF1697 family)